MEIITFLFKYPVLIICLVIFLVCKIVPPKNINDVYGYRSANSKKNKSNWDFAQKYSTNLFIMLLLLMIAIQIVLFYIDKNNPNIALITLVGLFLTIGIVFYKTEQKLKKMSS